MDTATLAAMRTLDRVLAPALAVPALDRIPVDQFLSHLGEYRTVLGLKHPELAADLGRQEVALSRAPAALRASLVRALVDDDAGDVYDLSAELGVAPELLYLVGQMAVRPYLWAYARGQTPPGAPGGIHCPVCGRKAHMGHIDADNIKFLHCPACETVWRTARVGCPTCGTTDPQYVGYLSVEGDAEHRVEYCTACGGYLKVVDQRVRGRRPDWLLEDAETEVLDQLAVAEGYHK
ncbi:MAG TPA: formate dehydrogenase accessory protein FdhE [Symbiobacteriaceae bacterium]|nr:formate dehydrogenase accessory protein FdhE [Symbiobacteriaceae bacterium]